MKRVATGFCVAATLGCIATVGAQTSTTATTAGQRAPMTDKARDVAITGCLSKGADGKYILTNARVDNPTGSSSTTTGTTGTTSAGTTTAGTTTPTESAAKAAAMSWALMGGTDLDKHVGHKIQVTGRTGWDSAMDHSRTPDTTAAAAGTTAGTTAGATGTSGTTTTATVEEMRKDMRADQPRLDVQSVKMIAPSCS